jgi:hypothetical protein
MGVDGCGVLIQLEVDRTDQMVGRETDDGVIEVIALAVVKKVAALAITAMAVIKVAATTKRPTVDCFAFWNGGLVCCG